MAKRFTATIWSCCEAQSLSMRDEEGIKTPSPLWRGFRVRFPSHERVGVKLTQYRAGLIAQIQNRAATDGD